MVNKSKTGEAAERDYALVIRAREGDQKAYAGLMALYEDQVYHFLLNRVNDSLIAEDLTIETFGKAFRNLHRFSPDYAFSTWLFRIALNHCIDFQRRQKNNPYERDGVGKQQMQTEVADETPDPEESFIREQRLNLMRETIEKLKPHYRMLIELRYFDELSYEEIAEKLELPIGTVKAQLFRARDLLYQILSGSREL